MFRDFFLNQVHACLRNYSKEGVSKLTATSCLFFPYCPSAKKSGYCILKMVKKSKECFMTWESCKRLESQCLEIQFIRAQPPSFLHCFPLSQRKVSCYRPVETWVPRWLSGEEPSCQHRTPGRHRSCPWVGKIPWRRKWQSTPARGACRGQSLGSQSRAQLSAEETWEGLVLRCGAVKCEWVNWCMQRDVPDWVLEQKKALMENVVKSKWRLEFS